MDNVFTQKDYEEMTANDDFLNQYKDLLDGVHTDEQITEAKEKYIENNIFKKTHQAKYLIKNAECYENLATNLLDIYMTSYPWSASFDKKTKNLYILNLICPENIPSFSLVGIKTFEQFLELTLAAAKKILVEENLDRILSDEEFNERLEKAHSVALKHKA